MEDYKARVLEEKKDLENKVASLDKFISSNQFNSVRFDEGLRMNAQLNVMKAYLDILVMRIANF
ncbi:hypothetical protein D3C87_1588560 [compost metagenome]